MTQRVCRYVTVPFVPAFAFLALTGCGLGGGNDLPSSVTVEFGDGSTAEVGKGDGVPSLKNSTWDFFRTASNGQGTVFVTVVFDEKGGLSRFENSTIASEIFGSTIKFDGIRHNTTQQGLQYVGATYGAPTSDATGFGFEGRVKAYAAGLEAATATASAWGQFDPDDSNIIRGEFAFTSRVTLLSIPEGNQDEEWTYIGHRVVAE